jgi:hypothetical protein
MPIGPDEDMFPRGLYKGAGPNGAIYDRKICGKLTIGQWLTGIATGEDKLTKMNWSDSKTKDEMESMGSLGNKVETVGAPGQQQAAPIFELRRIRQNLTPETTLRMALDTFDFIRRLNAGQAGAHYTRSN